ncbi:D-isomer specific 2-hydroxyacid dehydrogenase [Leishmania donovani]|uniref:D-isomer specific 2-hydroxyacid dehydrogenase, NAD binding domain family protein n=2 Tax=Leishmania donovani TaxID=5661 RepID=A0A504XNL3_LEIDO|nr:D-isomer specific 2-hydroxyacid dehydrogenase, NAD binding domain family protein [Leishmania donovani]TPP50376.1 D-isomer specific 2-hydroxyacid dehydrogenase, NAD binding domain family protein [Leishmania donovani]CAJ1992497.1 D-isomer specific 2-hydroxyacid dehydrogenase [Leishmania donovani]VDZ48330.1 d-isomer_specific_2-hydroxyacid_dehydrogenase-_protein/GeneDB:LmjF.34.1400 [Leishmania donovani]
MAPTICVCVDDDLCGAVCDVLKQLEGRISAIVCGTDVSCFASVKADNDGIFMVVSGSCAHAVIKDLCDDYDKEERRVKLIYSLSAGVDAYKLSELKQELSGILFCNAQGCCSNVLAEYVVFSMLYFNRLPWRLAASKNEKKWDPFSSIELRRQKLVIIGYGNIGEACGAKAVALGMQVTGIRRSGDKKTDKFGVMVRGNDALDESIREADFVVSVLPGTEHTRRFFDKAFFAKMKPSAVFINIGRGMSVCEADIIEALKKGTIRAAALDVFDVEPLPKDSPLWDLPDSKLLLSAHSANLTEDVIERTMKIFTDIFDELSTHGTVSAHTVCMDKGY